MSFGPARPTPMLLDGWAGVGLEQGMMLQRHKHFEGREYQPSKGSLLVRRVNLGVIPDTLTTPASKAVAVVIIPGECNRNRKALSKRQRSCLDIHGPDKLATPVSIVKRIRSG